MGVDIQRKGGFRPEDEIQEGERTPLLHPSPYQTTLTSNGSKKQSLTSIVRDEDAEERSIDSASSNELIRVRTPKTVTKSATAIILVLLIGVFVANADGSLVLASYGKIASEFNDLENASWLVTSYGLAMASCQPLYARLSDVYGRTNMILIAYSIFAIGCATSAIGQSLPAVVIGRAIAGSGGAGMNSLVAILITDLVPRRELGAWRSYVNVVATTGRAMGGPIGGYLADSVGWRWSFLGQCPLTGIAILSTWLVVPKQNTIDEDENVKSKLSRIDFTGLFLLSSMILLFMLSLELGGNQFAWDSPVIFGMLFAGSLLGILFIYVELSWSKEPVFDLRYLRKSSILLPDCIGFFQVSAQLGMMFTVPIYFQVTQDTSATVAGSHLFPAVLGVTVAGLSGGFIIKKTGRYKFLLIFGTICSSISYFLLYLRWHGHTSWLESLYIIPGGFGNGMVQSAGFIALTSTIDRSRVAMVTSTWFLSGNIGSILGTATTNAVIQNTLRRGLSAKLINFPNKNKIIERSLSDINYIQSLEGNLKEIVVGVYTKSLSNSHLVNFSCAIIALIASCFIAETPL